MNDIVEKWKSQLNSMFSINGNSSVKIAKQFIIERKVKNNREFKKFTGIFGSYISPCKFLNVAFK